MTGNQNRDASRSTFDNGGAAPWADLNHDALLLVMMQLGVIDFLAFSRVCKSWRSLALFNRERFMVSKPPMLTWISGYTYGKDYRYLCLRDIEGRMFKTNLPHSAGRTCFGSTCGYMILFGRGTSDFWLVNPISRHEIHFPNVHFFVDAKPEVGVRAVLVSSPNSISGWVFVILNRSRSKIWFSTAGSGVWDHVVSIYPPLDLHFLKGKIYAINASFDLYEMRLDPQPNLTILAKMDVEKRHLYHLKFVRAVENLLVMDRMNKTVHELDFGKMKWVLREDCRKKYVFFESVWELGADPALMAGFRSRRTVYNTLLKLNLEDMQYNHELDFSHDPDFMWYFPHECLHTYIMDE